MKKKLAIFDLDGTLLNSIYAISNAVNLTLREFSLKEYEIEDYYSFIGSGLKVLLERIIKKENYDISVDILLDRLIKIYIDNVDYKLIPYQGIVDMLQELIKNNVNIAIITNKEDYLAKKSCEIIDFKNINFIDIIGMDKNKQEEKKPSNINVRKLMNKLNVKEFETIFIGDMLVDYNTAKNSNIDFIYCNWGFGRIINEKIPDDCLIVNEAREIIKCIL